MSLVCVLSSLMCMILWSQVEANETCTNPEPCDFTDSICLTKAINRVYPEAVAGAPISESSDPLTKDSICIDTDDLTFYGKNVRLLGLSECVVKLLSMVPEEASFVFDLSCPKLKIEIGEYQVNGKLGEKQVVGSDDCAQIGLNGNDLCFTGFYESFFDGDHEFHTFMKYFDLELKFINVTGLFPGLTYADEECTDASKEDMNKLGDTIVKLLVDQLVPKLKTNLNGLCKAKPTKYLLCSNCAPSLPITHKPLVDLPGIISL